MNILDYQELDKFINNRDGENIYSVLNKIHAKRESSSIKRILFLDIDGILVTDKESDSTRDSKNYIWTDSDEQKDLKQRTSPPINLIFLKRLRELILTTDAYVVLSSTWRLDKEARQHLNKAFHQVGLSHETIKSMTGVLEYRYLEIEAWLRDNVDSTEDFTWCVIDDGPDELHRLSLLEKGHWVETNIKYGLTESIAKKCYDILMGL